MGVIDLDKRVRKLEQDGAGGAVVDQLEAAVTAIENELTVTVTDVTDDIVNPEGVTCNLATLETYGKIVHFHAEFVAESGNTGIEDTVYTVPETLRPRYNHSVVQVFGDSAATNGYNDGGIYVEYQFTEPGTVYADSYWIANPAPTPGE